MDKAKAKSSQIYYKILKLRLLALIFCVRSLKNWDLIPGSTYVYLKNDAE